MFGNVLWAKIFSVLSKIYPVNVCFQICCKSVGWERNAKPVLGVTLFIVAFELGSHL